MKIMRKGVAVVLSVLLLYGAFFTNLLPDWHPFAYEVHAEQNEALSEIEGCEPEVTHAPGNGAPSDPDGTAQIEEPTETEPAETAEPHATEAPADAPKPTDTVEQPDADVPPIRPEPEETTAPSESEPPSLPEGPPELEAVVAPSGALLYDGEVEEEDVFADDPELEGAGDVALGDYEVAFAAPGETLTLAIPIRHFIGEQVYASNADAQGIIRPYRAEDNEANFGQDIIVALSDVRVAVAGSQDERFPLDPGVISQERPIITGGRNQGYAVFEHVQVSASAEPGIHPVRLLVSWETASGERQAKMLTANIRIEEAEKESGDATLGIYEMPSAEVGGFMTLVFPVRYVCGGQVYDTNDDSNGDPLPFVGNPVMAFDQSLTSELSELSIAIAGEQAEDFPLDRSLLLESRALISQGANMGYAMFEAIPVLRDAEPGVYQLNLQVIWRDLEGSVQVKNVSASIEITPSSLVYDGGIIVFTFAELKSAVEGGVYSTVYLGYCDSDMPLPGETRNDGTISFTSSGGVKAYQSVTIIGTDPRNNKRMKLVDRQNSVHADTIHAEIGGITITLKSVDVTGYNFYGIVSGMSYTNVGIAFVDVNYAGRQMMCSYGTGTWVSFDGCNVTIQDMSSGNGQEVAEVAEVRFYGSNYFRRTAYTSGASNSMFWMCASPRQFTVAAGADVVLETNNYLIYDPGSTTKCSIDGSMRVTTNGSVGCMTYYDDDISEMTVSGSLSIVHNSTAYPSMRVRALTVNGSLDITKASSSLPCISVQASGSVNFNSPVRVSLQNANGRLIQGAGQLNITTQVINRWTTAAGGTNRYIWNNNNLSAFSISARTAASSTTVNGVTGLTDSKGVSLQSAPFTTANFNLTSSPRIILGRYSASINEYTVYLTSASVKGSAPSGSTQTVAEYACPGGVLGSRIQSVAAVTSGTGYQTSGGWLPISSNDNRVYVLSALNDLEAHIYADCIEICFLYYVPPTLDFGAVAISGYEQLVRRQDADWTIQILDTRSSGHWKLSATADPLAMTGGADTLPDALVFVPSSGPVQPMSQGASVLIAERPGMAALGIMDVNWAGDDGMMIHLNPYEGTHYASYSTTVTWTLECTDF